VVSLGQEVSVTVVEETPAVEETAAVAEAPAVEETAGVEETPSTEAAQTATPDAEESGGESTQAEEPRALSLSEIAAGLLGLPVVKHSGVSGAVEAAGETGRATTAVRDRENERLGDRLWRSAEKAALDAQERAERAAVERKRTQGQRLSAQRWIQ
jgi:hypothetical protein